MKSFLVSLALVAVASAAQLDHEGLVDGSAATSRRARTRPSRLPMPAPMPAAPVEVEPVQMAAPVEEAPVADAAADAVAGADRLRAVAGLPTFGGQAYIDPRAQHLIDEYGRIVKDDSLECPDADKQCFNEYTRPARTEYYKPACQVGCYKPTYYRKMVAQRRVYEPYDYHGYTGYGHFDKHYRHVEHDDYHGRDAYGYGGYEAPRSYGGYGGYGKQSYGGYGRRSGYGYAPDYYGAWYHAPAKEYKEREYTAPDYGDEDTIYRAYNRQAVVGHPEFPCKIPAGNLNRNPGY